jgi:hypothetical protein
MQRLALTNAGIDGPVFDLFWLSEGETSLAIWKACMIVSVIVWSVHGMILRDESGVPTGLRTRFAEHLLAREYPTPDHAMTFGIGRSKWNCVRTVTDHIKMIVVSYAGPVGVPAEDKVVDAIAQLTWKFEKQRVHDVCLYSSN